MLVVIQMLPDYSRTSENQRFFSSKYSRLCETLIATTISVGANYPYCLRCGGCTFPTTTKAIKYQEANNNKNVKIKSENI